MEHYVSIIDMEQKDIIIKTITEFLESAKDDEAKQRTRSAITMYFKVIVETCDLMIYNQILKIPFSHKNRFELLERFFPDISKEVSYLFKIYRKTYSQKVEKEDLEKVKNGCFKIFEKAGIDKDLPKPLKEQRIR